MSKQVVSSNKLSSLEVVDFAKFDNELIFETLDMFGTSLEITASEDIVITSTATATPWGISLLSQGPINIQAAVSDVTILAGSIVDAVETDGTIMLGASVSGVDSPAVEITYDASADAFFLGFFGATPVIQATTAITPAAFAANASGITADTATFGGYTLGEIAAALIAYGLLA